jgi:hypothetical protein
MDMFDYRFHYSVMVAEDRIRERHREADRQRRLAGARQHEPRADDRPRWNIGDLVGILVPSRGAR